MAKTKEQNKDLEVEISKLIARNKVLENMQKHHELEMQGL